MKLQLPSVKGSGSALGTIMSSQFGCEEKNLIYNLSAVWRGFPSSSGKYMVWWCGRVSPILGEGRACHFLSSGSDTIGGMGSGALVSLTLCDAGSWSPWGGNIVNFPLGKLRGCFLGVFTVFAGRTVQVLHQDWAELMTRRIL